MEQLSLWTLSFVIIIFVWELISSAPRYQYVTLEDAKEAETMTEKDGRIKEISKPVMDYAFHIKSVPMSEDIQGFHGLVTSEGLHTFGNRLHERLILTLLIW